VVFASGVVTLDDAVVAGAASIPNLGTGAITLDGVGIWATNKPPMLIGTVPAMLPATGNTATSLSAMGTVPATLTAGGVIPAAQSLTGSVPAGLTLTGQVST
jgi:hypothetical protein